MVLEMGSSRSSPLYGNDADALLLQHVPDKSEHLLRYYAHYSNRTRGERADRLAHATFVGSRRKQILIL